MKKIIIFIILVTGHWSLVTKNVSAHVLKTSGPIGAVIHVEPADDPIVGEPSPIFFEFKDKEGKFNPADCDCVVTVTNSTGSVVYTNNLFESNSNPSLDNASLTFTFPQKDIYKIEVTGSPKSSETFEPFTISYEVRVARESIKPSSTAEKDSRQKVVESTLIFIALIVAFVIFGVYKNKKRR